MVTPSRTNGLVKLWINGRPTSVKPTCVRAHVHSHLSPSVIVLIVRLDQARELGKVARQCVEALHPVCLHGVWFPCVAPT